MSRTAVVISGTVMGNKVIGFDPFTRRWVASTSSEQACEGLPSIEGQILIDQYSRSVAAEDFGHIVFWYPSAVLKPRALSDIAKLVRFCRDRSICVAMRGQGHSTYGQAQARDGLVIDSRELKAVHKVEEGRIVIDAGACWRCVLNASLPSGQAPPVLTDFLGLSVGGTLSVAGFGGTSSRHGTQADNVLELDVVLPNGELHTCSPNQEPDLFEAVLCGLGQCGLIVRATLALAPVPAKVRRYKLHYHRLSDLIKDQCRLVEQERFDYLEGQVYASQSGGSDICLKHVPSLTAGPTTWHCWETFGAIGR